MKKFLIFLLAFSIIIVIRIAFIEGRTIRVALIQMKIKYGDRSYNTSRAVDMINKAVENDIQIVCLPEAFDIGWIAENSDNLAEEIPGKTSMQLAECARENKIFIIASGTERDGEKIFNTAYIINKKGKIILKHRKLNISDVGLLEQVRIYDAGDVNQTKIADTEFGKIGLAVGSDIIYGKYKIIKKLAELGAELVFLPSGWISSLDPSGNNAKKVGNYIEEVFIREAKENNLTLLGVNSAETVYDTKYLKNSEFIGHSIITDHKKGLIGTGEYLKEEIVIAAIKY
jgi:predicted amidohydrolase